MIAFHRTTPPTTATTFEEARDLWATSKAAQPLNSYGHRWLADLFALDRDQAPPDKADWYARKIWEHQVLAAAIDAPCAYELPLT